MEEREVAAMLKGLQGHPVSRFVPEFWVFHYYSRQIGFLTALEALPSCVALLSLYVQIDKTELLLVPRWVPRGYCQSNR